MGGLQVTRWAEMVAKYRPIYQARQRGHALLFTFTLCLGPTQI